MPENLELPLALAPPPVPRSRQKKSLVEELSSFCEFGRATHQRLTRCQTYCGSTLAVPTFVNEFWTARQRAANRLHEISYRACFKPQLPRFFIERLSAPGDRVYDPFMGRGTTPLEAALLQRVPLGCDANPLSAILTRPRLRPPYMENIERRLREINLSDPDDFSEDLLVFFHPETLRQIASLRKYFRLKEQSEPLDPVDDWIRLLALNRLTGHSTGFFSVYTMPPNQAVSVKSQRRINEKRNQTPPPRDVSRIILRKSRILLANCHSQLRQSLVRMAEDAQLLTQPAAATPQIKSESVALVVTSPPFLNVVDYSGDNWLRCWFLGIDPASVKLTVPRKVSDWQMAMSEVFRELHRVLRSGGHIAFEVGE